jgi:adenylosuccinate lyase
MSKRSEGDCHKSREHQFAPEIGGTRHHAEPTAFGLVARSMTSLTARPAVDTAAQASPWKMSGAVGTSSHLSPKIELRSRKAACARRPSPRRSQRDLRQFRGTPAVGASIERWATHSPPADRVLETGVCSRAGGSSAMPHKRNPITGERLTGLARVLRGNAVAALENVALWHERDISHSSVERIIFPDSCTLLDYMLVTLTKLVDGLVVYPENMKRNLKLSLGMWNSQTVLLALIRKGLTREQAYDLVQRNAMQTWEVKHAGRDDADFVEQLKSDPEVARHFKNGELEKLCSLDFHFKEIKSRFKKLGL